VANGLDTSARALKAVARVERGFGAALGARLNEYLAHRRFEGAA
jgi:hypothetical protein